MSNKYGLSFITDNDLFEHVKETIEKYRFTINLKEFNKNLVDPIKLTFDSKIYRKTIEEIIESKPSDAAILIAELQYLAYKNKDNLEDSL